MKKELKELVILIRGAGEMATGVAVRLFRSNFRKILMLETASPLAVRRRVSFCEAVHDGSAAVEGIEAIAITDAGECAGVWASGGIAVIVDPRGDSVATCKPDVFIDATLAKRNIGTTISDAHLVVALGPGFNAGIDCHVVIETNRGHDLGRLIISGSAAANTGIPGNIAGYTKERVLRAPIAGIFVTERRIGELVRKGEKIGHIGSSEVTAQIDGIMRGLIRPGSVVKTGLKVGDIDPRCEAIYCETVSEKARALGGAVLEAVLEKYSC